MGKDDDGTSHGSELDYSLCSFISLEGADLWGNEWKPVKYHPLNSAGSGAFVTRRAALRSRFRDLQAQADLPGCIRSSAVGLGQSNQFILLEMPKELLAEDQTNIYLAFLAMGFRSITGRSGQLNPKRRKKGSKKNEQVGTESPQTVPGGRTSGKKGRNRSAR